MPEFRPALLDPFSRVSRLIHLALFSLAVIAQLAGAAALWVEAHNALAAEGLVIAAAATCIFAALEIRRLSRSASGLQHELHLHRRIFETSLDLIFVTDSQGRFIDVSPSSFALLGYRPEEMIGRSATAFIHPDDLEKTRDEMRAGRRGRQQRNFATRYLRRDGHSITLNWAGVWSEPEQRHFFIGRDLAEEQRLMEAERAAKETLTAVIDASPVAIICLAPDTLVTVWSRAAEQIFGYKADDVIGKPYALVPTGEQAQAEYTSLFARALAGETMRGIQVQRQRKDGTVIDISFDAAPMRGASGIEGVAYALSDVTDSKRLEQQLRHSQRLDAIGQLTGGVAHDFNNMLTVITGTIDILADAVTDKPDIHAIAKLISEAADRGADLTRQLLAFARKQPLQPRKTGVNDVVAEAAKLLRPTLGEHIEVEWKLDSTAWPALVDPAQLSTAIVNLAVNARDAMKSGGKLTLETANVYLDEDYANAHSEVIAGPYVMVAVTDTGSGIPPEIREKVFEPFFTTKDVGKGTGLGLSMVYGFVKQSGGHIKLYSEEAQGTTFKIYLPRADEGSASAAEQASATQVGGGRETILLVEDDATVRRSVNTQLHSLGYKTILASNGAEALAVVDGGEAFDLLFTDLIMPGAINGRQLAEEVRKRRGSVKVLFTSGYTEDSVVHRRLLEPGLLLLTKPYRKTDLARSVRQALTSDGEAKERASA
jgi:PAS domain S-box-containing protein